MIDYVSMEFQQPLTNKIDKYPLPEHTFNYTKEVQMYVDNI